ncbi:hypothetical protein LOZ12_002355 [Ophidiomyces ophidiicola]|uniref:Uncharacterized protein n=1 Tax=Ophidiomyces ophidiicola TaxID=1387563 RepID=A0ACB8UXW3_9EURO|nr:hypothetical protein LOZ62_003755 [Ophidiomyces ophidiicola]KAI1972301.1 hypothetical protein LOZ56_002518 [Ophidiomyces ophidiicola]KAI2005887.1 hypothetical protein LOZ50_003423 [Ophidiomyces ophidiicola]KAI2025549.1 hypothetical protein LOZ48_005361 [Ophidiomyces ophidiicola]KAI2038434.1 hypothetical protein LOZ47_003207 [Ophidiomyces ophidiicola]
MSVSGSPSESGYLFASKHLTSAIDDGDDDIDSLPSSSASDSSLEDHISMYDIDDDDDDSDAEAEWQESMRQLELLLTMVVIPFAGKFLGRKCAYWGWAKFMEWKHPFEGSIGYGVEFPRAIPAITSATL